MRKWMALFAVGISAVCVLLVANVICSPDVAVFSPQRIGDTVLLIDAGHGGADGGAVSPSGTVESGINLEIAQKLDLLAGLYGVPDVMIRADENSIHDASAQTLRQQKRSDLENRVKLINETGNGVLISIHQNMYSGSSSHGTQVFYRDQESQAWAAATQDLFRQHLAPDNTRQAAQISSEIYLMSHINCPAILVECGFLSNPEDEKLLREDLYQMKIAAILLDSYLFREHGTG